MMNEYMESKQETDKRTGEHTWWKGEGVYLLI